MERGTRGVRRPSTRIAAKPAPQRPALASQPPQCGHQAIWIFPVRELVRFGNSRASTPSWYFAVTLSASTS